MKSYFLVEPGVIELRETPIPKPDKGELIVKVETALTCGTDLKAYRRGHPKMPMPTPFGHEFSGTIVDAGASVNGYTEGDAIMGVHTAPCNDCYYCRRNLENLCPETMGNMMLGAYAEYVKIPRPVVEQNTFTKPHSLSHAEAAILEPLACVVHGIEPLHLKAEDSVLIIGAGAIGLLHILMAKVKGAQKIIVAGKHAGRLKLAQQLGADFIIDVSTENSIASVLEMTKGFGANWVFECTGRPEVWEQSVSTVSKGGNIILFGGCPSGTSITFDSTRLHYDEISLIGSFHFTPRDVKIAHALLVEKKLDVRPLISAQYHLGDLEKAFNLLMEGQGVKYAIRP